MLQSIAFGLAVGAGVQAWRAFPPDAPFTGSSVALVFIVGVVAAYLGGRWHGRGRGGAVAVAQAEAHATATAANTVNVAVVVPGGGARSAVGIPTESAPWLAGATDRPQVTAADLDGMDLSEFAEDATEDVR